MSLKPAKTRAAEEISVRVKPVAKGLVQVTIIETATGNIYQRNWRYVTEFDRYVASAEVSLQRLESMIDVHNQFVDALREAGVSEDIIHHCSLAAQGKKSNSEEQTVESESEPTDEAEEEDDSNA